MLKPGLSDIPIIPIIPIILQDFLTFQSFLLFLSFLSSGEETKICGSYTPVQYEYYTQTIICPTEGTGFMVSAYDKTGVKTILELYEIKVGVII